jgi:hypothetical protein
MTSSSLMARDGKLALTLTLMPVQCSVVQYKFCLLTNVSIQGLRDLPHACTEIWTTLCCGAYYEPKVQVPRVQESPSSVDEAPDCSLDQSEDSVPQLWVHAHRRSWTSYPDVNLGHHSRTITCSQSNRHNTVTTLCAPTTDACLLPL